MIRTRTLDEAIKLVDDQIAAGFLFMRFTGVLERSYEKDGRQERIRFLIGTGIVAVVLYDLFLLSDWQMIPDLLGLACVFRLAIFTPLTLATFYIAARSKSETVREGLFSGLAIIAVVLITDLSVRSKSPDHGTYHYGTMLIMMFSTCVQRLRFQYAVLGVLGMLASQIIGASISDAMNGHAFVSEVIFFTTAGILLLCAAYSLERENRRGYLLALRGRLLNEQLEQSAKIDPLTGLWNRRHLELVMKSAWREAISGPVSMAVILCDIDHFKSFNDSYGHLEGDTCLQRVAECLTSMLVDHHGVATRFGGEEFLIFLPGLDGIESHAIAERLRRGLRTEAIPHPVFGADAIVSASFGVAAGMAPSTSPATLIDAADTALYQAKRDGRDCVRIAIDGAMEQPDSRPSARGAYVSSDIEGGLIVRRKPSRSVVT